VLTARDITDTGAGSPPYSMPRADADLGDRIVCGWKTEDSKTSCGTRLGLGIILCTGKSELSLEDSGKRTSDVWLAPAEEGS
jgi:hypothetical protein